MPPVENFSDHYLEREADRKPLRLTLLLLAPHQRNEATAGEHLRLRLAADFVCFVQGLLVGRTKGAH
jgi:hypothetical protein